MQINLIAGDHDWSTEGTHVCNENGFASILDIEKTIDVNEETYNRIMPIIEGARINRGLNPDGSIPTPPPEEGSSNVVDINTGEVL